MPTQETLTCVDCPAQITYSGSGRRPERCAACIKERAAQRGRDYYEKHRDEVNAYTREYKRERRKNPDVRARERRTRELGRDESAARSREWREANPASARASARRYRKNNPEKGREQGWRQQGIDMTWPRFIETLESQQYRCANGGCARSLDTSAHVDHCHATRVVRGILCGACNAAAGQVKDRPSVLIGLAEYLEAHS